MQISFTSRLTLALLLILPCITANAAPLPPLVCPAGGPLGTFDIRVGFSKSAEPLPVRTVNRMEEGAVLYYRPVLRSGEVRKGEVTFVLAPADPQRAGEQLAVLDPKDAGRPAQWNVPWRVGVVLFAYGPAGLNARKVRSFLSRDSDLIPQLADFAEKTAQAEALIAALSSPNSSSENIESALKGFSGRYSTAASLDRTAPVDQQAMMMIRTLQPVMTTWDPIAPQDGAQFSQTAGLATSVAMLFFGYPVGLAAGGTAMLMELRSAAFPRAEFRSSLSQAMPNDWMGLCGRRDPVPPHTHVTYLWASRIPNIGPPQLTIDKGNHLPAGAKSPLPVSASEADWKYIERARNWTLQMDGGKPAPVHVVKLGDRNTLELDVPANLKAGSYTLAANWDWDRLQTKGHVIIHPLDAFKSAHLSTASQDVMVAHTGKVPAAIEGDDFEFVTKVEVEKLNDKFSTPSPVPFALAGGLRQGPQERMDIQVNTGDLDPGDYKFLLTQLDGKTHPVNFKILPAPARINSFPILLNEGVEGGKFTLKGERLDELKRIEVAGATAVLEPACGSGVERALKLNFNEGHTPAAGTSLAVKAWIADRSEPLTFADAVRVVGARPLIVDAAVSQPPDLNIRMGPGELPGGVFLSVMLRAQHLQSNSTVKLSCGQPSSRSVTLHLGERSGPLSFQQIAPDQVFLSFDSSAWPNGCALEAAIANGAEGRSDPYVLGRVVRIPSLDRFEPAGDSTDDSDGRAALIGENLETIEKAGWTPDDPVAADVLPLPITGAGQKQALRLKLGARPDSHSPLYIWLRGETNPRIVSRLR